jgi:hypothetical protein
MGLNAIVATSRGNCSTARTRHLRMLWSALPAPVRYAPDRKPGMSAIEHKALVENLSASRLPDRRLKRQLVATYPLLGHN